MLRFAPDTAMERDHGKLLASPQRKAVPRAEVWVCRPSGKTANHYHSYAA